MNDTYAIPSLSRSDSRPGLTGRALTLAYGVGVYVFFLATFLLVIGFLERVVVPKHIDSGPQSALWPALLVDGAFLAAFAVQHMIMARPRFKERWTRIVPAAAERSTFVLAACLILCTLVWQWRPLPTELWRVEGAAAWGLRGLSALGWSIVLFSTFLIDHFELFGLRQTVMHALGRTGSKRPFVERSLYRVVRHPLMLGFLVAFWATPVMTVGRLLFAALCTGYILVGTRIEERDLIAEHGEAYVDYRQRVPGLVPLRKRAS